MITPILQIKTAIPPLRSGAISRRRLLALLDQGMDHALIVLSAPPGFGKTTLVRTWVETIDHETAWLSLESVDSEPIRFLTYLTTALQTTSPSIGATILQALQFSQAPEPEAMLTTLLNDVGTYALPVILVLDDYHLVNVAPVNNAVTFLLNHRPPNLHIVITTREDPQLPLSRLRARGEMMELRAADLRFTPDEASLFLHEVMGLHIPPDEVAVLETRTEGWIAGLQLAALSMRGNDDLPGFIQSFAGDDRYIVDYLFEEVLRRQPAETQRFLLQSSILERLNGPLCDAITGRDDSAALLDALERGNLFVLPLDNKRKWYRYHQLFADVLRASALAEESDQLPALHVRASEWFEQHEMPADAIRHALAGNDYYRAAMLMERCALHMLGSRDEDTLWQWLHAIPESVIERMPVLQTYYGFAAFSRAGLDAAESRFEAAEQWLHGTSHLPASRMIVISELAFRSLPGTIAVGRAYAAGAVGDVEGIVAQARRAVQVMPADEDLWNGAALAVLGIGLWTSGELEPAYRSFDEGKTRLEKAGYMQFQFVSVHILADIRMAQGRLRDAERLYREALERATCNGEAQWGTADALVGLSEVALERNDLALATEFLRRSKELGDHAGLMDTRHRWYVVMAGIKLAEGDFEGSLDMLDQADRLYVRGADPDLHPIPALKARVWLAQGRLGDAIAWAKDHQQHADDDLRYLDEFMHMTVVRILLAYSQHAEDFAVGSQALDLLNRMLEAAESGGRKGSLLRILGLEALAHEAVGDLPSALAVLERALSLAEPEGYVRAFVGEGPAMKRLLAAAQSQGDHGAYAARLYSAMVSLRATPPPHATTSLLSDRESEVLQMIAAGLSNREMSEQLYVALDTVKGHNRRLFAKLGVQRRTEAIARARELGLLKA